LTLWPERAEWPDTDRQKARYGRELTSGEVGCFASHFSAISEFLEGGLSEWLLVLEDDVVIDGAFPYHRLASACSAQGIDYIRLFAKMWKPAVPVNGWYGYQIIRFLTDPYGTQAYLINRNGARRFIDSVDSINLPIDDELGRFWVNNLPPYAVYPYPAFERYSQSSLEGQRQSASTKRAKAPYDLERLTTFARKKTFNMWMKRKEKLGAA
jgi:glycosyl transferase family 25